MSRSGQGVSGLVINIVHVSAFTIKLEVLWPWLLPSAMAVLLAALWVIRSRQAGGGSAVSRSEPPPGLSPAAAGALLSENVNARHIAATIFDLALRRHLTIREAKTPSSILTGRDFLFGQLTDHWNELNLNHYEVRVLSTLFGSGVRPSMSTLRTWKAFARVWPLAGKAIIDELIGLEYFRSDPRRLRRRSGLLAAALAAVTPLLPLLAMYWRGSPAWLWSAAGATACLAPLCLAFMLLMPKRTAAGNLACGQVKGFRRYLRHAERFQPPPEVFAKYLPYAIALGETWRWANYFRGRPMDGICWFQGGVDHGAGLDPEVLKRDIEHFIHLLKTALSAPLGHRDSQRHYLGVGPGAAKRPW